MSASSTVERTLVPGPVLRRGPARSYRSVSVGPGEPHLVREDLTTEGAGSHPARPARRPLLGLAHATDLQLTDVQSPARMEFCDRHADDPRFHLLVPMHRPQEALGSRAVQAMVSALNGVNRGPAGADLHLVVTTGDAIDNAQWNELQAFMALLEGGTVQPGSGGPRYQGVQSPEWDDDTYWRPDAPGDDWWQRSHGYPHVPGLLDDALAGFEATGLRLPWLTCLGNHEILAQGVGQVTPALQRHLVGSAKPAGPLTGVELDALHDLLVSRPESFLTGDSRVVTADPGRRAVSRAEFVDAHFSALSRPFGHGFTEENRRSGTAYYVHDVGPVRFVCLDTTCSVGAADGCLDAEQARWLEEQLVEVSSSHLARDGSTVRTGASDRLVVVVSHHGRETMGNRRLELEASGARTGRASVDGSDLCDLLHRFDNVVAWINGHTHHNLVVPRPDPQGRTGGFWEITTSAIADWPCQARLLELLDNRDGTLSLVSTMLDHDGLVQPDLGAPRTGAWLAGLHRELSGNEPWRGFVSGRAGTPADRNVDLRLPAPFPLAQLPAFA